MFYLLVNDYLNNLFILQLDCHLALDIVTLIFFYLIC